MQLLITGAAGFIGQHTCAEAVRQGYSVLALARSWSTHRHVPGTVRITLDLATANLPTQLQALRPDAIIHLAGRAHKLIDNAANPLDAFRRVNRDVTLNLAAWAASVGVRRFVYVSSIGVNGTVTTDGQNFDENSPANPCDPYAISKHEAELGLRELANGKNLEVCIVRPPLVYGPSAPGNFKLLMWLLSKGIPMPFDAITNRRSFIYVENLANALVICAVHPAAAGRTFLVSDGSPMSTPELLRLMAASAGYRLRMFSIPVGVMRMVFTLIGKADMFGKLAGSLEVDDRHIRHALQWNPPFDTHSAMRRTFSGLCR